MIDKYEIDIQDLKNKKKVQESIMTEEFKKARERDDE
jgi:hypothetical protein